ncbi:MAG: radical SAM protein [Candidatus Nanoarchaeia archaeon]|nr:radical SAM protein [Candidatus Nanoarchaeia archaeon]
MGVLGIAKRVLDTTISKNLGTFIYLTTFRCNGTCDFCCFKNSINKKFDELSIDEIKKIIEKLPEIKDLAISGGETFLRKDIVEICKEFNKIKPDELCLPTNGIMTEYIAGKTEEILKNINYKLVPTVSVEGMEKTHNKSRGHFRETVATCAEFRKLREKYPEKFDFKINTVIRKDNIDELDEFSDWVYTNIKPSYHSFELVREKPCHISDMLPEVEKLKKMKAVFMKNSKRYDLGYGGGLRTKLTASLNSALFDYYISIIENKKALPCLAGKLSTVLYPNGDVSVCELLPPIGNVRDYEYDIPKMLKNAKIPKNCWCTHTCFQIANVKYSLRGWNVWLKKILKAN